MSKEREELAEGIGELLADYYTSRWAVVLHTIPRR